ncbi:predicted protein [Aspergillus terreus NIH2624]|uniref:Uncharacterized protein n=1 Tax=Aspergillus terreus (strain NIH 2624 / FGSC A1156) TaxID=341663 RepID=Q0CTZ9_ASPTN|nr:uncharacterized protein ATEG_02835 [Aspergillus terreus NIH2624]EAU36109.1 predicted protein [Aspergillus terreus NIH2624]
MLRHLTGPNPIPLGPTISWPLSPKLTGRIISYLANPINNRDNYSWRWLYIWNIELIAELELYDEAARVYFETEAEQDCNNRIFSKLYTRNTLAVFSEYIRMSFKDYSDAWLQEIEGAQLDQ